MPKKLERRLKREAIRKFPGDKESQDRYVYGAMNNLGLLHKKKKTGDEDEHDYR